MFYTPVATSIHCDHPISTAPHVNIHMDLNKTIIATDGAAKLDTDDVLIYALACYTNDLWYPNIKEPISYVEYVKFYLLPNPQKDPNIKKKQYQKIKGFLRELELSDHPKYPHLNHLFEKAKKKLKSLDSFIFPSFFKLLRHLQEKKISHTLFFRTFGNDGDKVIEEIVAKTGLIITSTKDRFQEGELIPVHGTEDLYSYIQRPGHRLVQDDWKWWFSHGEKAQFGKPFIVDESNPERLSIFFDDHAVPLLTFPEKNIVAPLSPEGNFLDIHDLIEKGFIVPVNTIEAIIDDHYFIKHLDKAIETKQKLVL
jgi:hypothetical protein